MFTIYLLIMDETGHHYGYESPEYLEALKKLDNWIGRITKNRQQDKINHYH